MTIKELLGIPERTILSFSLRFDNVQDLEACLDKYREEIYDSDRKVTFIIGDH